MRMVFRSAVCVSFLAVWLVSGPASADTSCTLLADASTGKVVYQDGECDRRVPPQSTFKVPLALMGYDAGFLKDAHDPKLPFREGYPDWIKSWRNHTDPSAWMKNSVVWYSHEITGALGKSKFREYVQAFDYGNGDVSGDAGKDNGLTRSWISSSLRISPVEQLDFLGKIVHRKLPISEQAYAMTEAILERHALPNGWDVAGKTGSGFSVRDDGEMDRNRPFGWYVGWAEKGDRIVLFARLKELSKPQKMSPGMGSRDDLLKQLPALLDQIVTD